MALANRAVNTIDAKDFDPAKPAIVAKRTIPSAGLQHLFLGCSSGSTWQDYLVPNVRSIGPPLERKGPHDLRNRAAAARGAPPFSFDHDQRAVPTRNEVNEARDVLVEVVSECALARSRPRVELAPKVVVQDVLLCTAQWLRIIEARRTDRQSDLPAFCGKVVRVLRQGDLLMPVVERFPPRLSSLRSC